MSLVSLEAGIVRLEEVGIALDDEHVLGVFHLSLVREIETAGDHRLAIYDHDLVMGDGVVRIDPSG